MAHKIRLNGGPRDGETRVVKTLYETFQSRDTVDLETGETVTVEHVYAIQRRGGSPMRHQGRVSYYHVPDLVMVVQ